MASDMAAWLRVTAARDSEDVLGVRGCFRMGVVGPDTLLGAGDGLSGRLSGCARRRMSEGVTLRLGVVGSIDDSNAGSGFAAKDTLLGVGMDEEIEDDMCVLGSLLVSWSACGARAWTRDVRKVVGVVRSEAEGCVRRRGVGMADGVLASSLAVDLDTRL